MQIAERRRGRGEKKNHFFLLPMMVQLTPTLLDFAQKGRFRELIQFRAETPIANLVVD